MGDFNFKSRDQIEALLKDAYSTTTTQGLLSMIESIKQERDPFFLTLAELDQIFRWKLRGQYGRQQSQRSLITNENARLITQTTFSFTNASESLEIKSKILILTVLPGVGVPVASAILAMVFPESYGVIDTRNWKVLYGEDKNYFTHNDYILYLTDLRALAHKWSFTVQQIDLALWKYYEILS
ncbi:MAG: hypothetical protein ACE362_08395 [Phaeodactylibacter xiamenensis]|uniref:hypothetical protein n=1 Tax=Phaeodactylibacter xiamenensis TaxID=1524460 RepID=UPI000695E933|nr:hypothetical protein [Phaeodactylibacter xiamenensis]